MLFCAGGCTLASLRSSVRGCAGVKSTCARELARRSAAPPLIPNADIDGDENNGDGLGVADTSSIRGLRRRLTAMGTPTPFCTRCALAPVWRKQMEIRAAAALTTTALGGGFPLCSADSDELDVRVPSAVAELNDAQVLNARWVLDSAYDGHLWTRATRSARSIVLPGRCSRVEAPSDAQCGFTLGHWNSGRAACNLQCCNGTAACSMA